MKIKLKELYLNNFKGVPELTVQFGDTTEVIGKNKTGKTTIYDAYLWLWTGKDSQDKADFAVKPLDKNGKAVSRQENIVFARLDIDGKETTLKKMQKEKWQKKRGETQTRFTGHETKYWIDDVPQTANQFSVYLDSLIKESRFRLLTNPRYFNSTLGWKERREILFNVSGGVDDYEILNRKMKEHPDRDEFNKIGEFFDKGMGIDAFRKSIREKKKKVEEELQNIPPKIAERKRGMPEERDFSEIEKQLEEKNKEIEDVESYISDRRNKSKELQESINEKSKKINQFQREVADIRDKRTQDLRKQKSDLSSAVSDKENEKVSWQKKIESSEKLIKEIRIEIEQKNELLKKLRAEFKELKEKELDFGEQEFVCPVCKGSGKVTGDENLNDATHQIEHEKSDTIEKFNKEKTQRLSEINETGKDQKEELERLTKNIEYEQEKIQTAKKEISRISGEIRSMNTDLEKMKATISEEEQFSDEEIAPEKMKEIARLKKEMNEVKLPDISDLTEQKKQLEVGRDKIKEQLKDKQEIQKIKNRIKELENEEKEYSQQKADLEKYEDSADEFVREKVTTLEGRVNEMFRHVKFKMFDTQINQAEVETCETLIDGVPYRDANNGSQIIGGLDIIKTLSEHYNIYAPVWVDNREAITNFDYTMVDSQLINLVVDEKYDKLTVENNKSNH